MIPAVIAGLTAVGTLTGVIVAVTGGAPSTPQARALAPLLPATTPTTGPVLPGFGDRAQSNFAVPAARLTATEKSVVAPLHRLLQADVLIVSSSSLPSRVLRHVLKMRGVVAAEQIEAVRVRLNGKYAAVLGVDPSVFRSYAQRPTARSDALWNGVANGGIAVSYTMGRLDKLPLGGYLRATGATSKRLPVVAFGTLGIGGVDAVVSDRVAKSLGMPAGNAIVVSTKGAPGALVSALKKIAPRGASVQPLVTQVGGAVGGSGGQVMTTAQALTMLHAAYSRRGLPYVWGATGPSTFDCSGLVKWSFALAGVTMPRVAADQALTGPVVPVSRLKPGDLLFYHTDPTAPGYISHVAIYIGNGWMIQAPAPGLTVEVVPADFGTEFAGAVQVNPALAAQVAARAA